MTHLMSRMNSLMILHPGMPRIRPLEKLSSRLFEEDDKGIYEKGLFFNSVHKFLDKVENQDENPIIDSLVRGG